MSATITLIVIMDPPGTVPVFLSLVGRKPVGDAGAAARQAVLVSLLVISLFAVAGQAILAYLGIGIPALQGAGGLLLLLIALQLLTGNGHEAEAATEDVNVALVPLGTPLLAGPGAIAATIVFVRQADGHIGAYIALALAIVDDALRDLHLHALLRRGHPADQGKRHHAAGQGGRPAARGHRRGARRELRARLHRRRQLTPAFRVVLPDRNRRLR